MQQHYLVSTQRQRPSAPDVSSLSTNPVRNPDSQTGTQTGTTVRATQARNRNDAKRCARCRCPHPPMTTWAVSRPQNHLAPGSTSGGSDAGRSPTHPAWPHGSTRLATAAADPPVIPRPHSGHPLTAERGRVGVRTGIRDTLPKIVDGGRGTTNHAVVANFFLGARCVQTGAAASAIASLTRCGWEERLR